MKAALLALTLLALSACTTDAQDAAEACGGLRNPIARQMCVSNYLTNAKLQHNAEWETVGASMLNRPRTTTCMNIGGIVTCQ